LGHLVDDLRGLMQQLIAEWERQAGVLLAKYGYENALRCVFTENKGLEGCQ